MALKKGMGAVKESLAKSQNRNSGSNKYETTNWFGWKAGETKVLRFLTDSDGIYVVPVHEQVEGFDGRKKTFACREAFESSCELCANKVYRRDVGYGIAVLREEVYEEIDGQRTLTGYKDVVETYETEEDGKTVTKRKPYVGIVSQGMRNFWAGISLISEKYGSLKDREIEIIRQGQGTDTQYMPFALDKKTIENIDERYKKFVPDLEAFLTRIGSEDYYAAQLHGIKKEAPASTSSSSSSSSSDSYDDEYEEDSYEGLNEETEAERLRKQLAGK